MKKILLFALLFSSAVFAQSTKKQDLINKLTESTCNCTTKKKSQTNKVKVTLGLCMLESINDNKSEVFKAYNKKNIDSELIEKVGEDIGENMIDTCPEIMEILLNDDELMKEIAEDNDIDTSSNEDEDLTISGIFTETKLDSYLYVVVKENTGKINNFVVLQNFDNVFLVTDKVLKPNDSVTVTYYESELFDPKLNKFISFKVITDITKK